MQKAAYWLVCIGLFFAFITAEVAGIDLLIDAVGYLFVFNGVRALRKEGTRLSPLLPALSMALVAVCAAELVLLSLAPALYIIRLVLEGIFFVLLLIGLSRDESMPRFAAPRRVLGILLASVFAVAGVLLPLAALLLPGLLPAAALLALPVRLAVLVYSAGIALLYTRGTP